MVKGYEIHAEYSVDDGPWHRQMYAVYTEDPLPTVAGAARKLKELVAEHKGIQLQRVKVRRTQVLVPVRLPSAGGWESQSPEV